MTEEQEGGMRGALVGWRRKHAQRGCITTLQVAETDADIAASTYRHITVSVADCQLG